MLRLGKPSKAIELLEKYVKEHTEEDNKWVYRFLARGYTSRWLHLSRPNKEMPTEDFNKMREYLIKCLKYEHSRIDGLDSLIGLGFEYSALRSKEFRDEVLSCAKQLVELMPFNADALLMLRVIEKYDPEKGKSINDFFWQENTDNYITKEEEIKSLYLSDLEDIAKQSRALSQKAIKENDLKTAIEQITKAITYYRFCAYDFELELRVRKGSSFEDDAEYADVYFSRFKDDLANCYIEYAEMISDTEKKVELYKTAVYYYRLQSMYYFGKFETNLSAIQALQKKIKEKDGSAPPK